jgi:DNA-binding transcriptional LysR family regulator
MLIFMPSLRDVDARNLAALIAVVDEGTFAKGAKSLGFTQSAVSQQIAALEKAAGLPVFDRPKGPRAAELTPAGQLLVDYARAALAEVDRMDDELDRMRRGVSGRLVIGTFQSASSRLLPWIVGNMRKDLPDVDIRLSELDDVQLLVRALLDDDLDFAFTIDLEPDPALDIELLGVDPFVVIAPRGEADAASACAADLNDRPLIGQPNNDSCQLMIDRRLEAVGIRPDYVFRSQDNGAVQGMVRSGLGWAIMPYLAIDPHDPGVTVLQLDPPVAPRLIQLVCRADRTLPAAADHFASLARSAGLDVLQTPAASVA